MSDRPAPTPEQLREQRYLAGAKLVERMRDLRTVIGFLEADQMAMCELVREWQTTIAGAPGRRERFLRMLIEYREIELQMVEQEFAKLAEL